MFGYGWSCQWDLGYEGKQLLIIDLSYYLTHIQEEELTPLPTQDVKDEEDDEVWGNLETVIDKTSTKKKEGKRRSAAEDIATANTTKKKKKKKGV